VLTGGMTKLKGIRELAQAIFQNSPVRIALPREMTGLTDELRDSAFSTVIGLLLYQSGEHTQYEIDNDKNMLHNKSETPEQGLKDIRLDTDKKETTKNKNEEYSRDTIGNKVLQDAEFGEDSDTFSFDDLPRPDKSEVSLISRFTTWAKQLF